MQRGQVERWTMGHLCSLYSVSGVLVMKAAFLGLFLFAAHIQAHYRVQGDMAVLGTQLCLQKSVAVCVLTGVCVPAVC